jgi:hypothetical protein
MRHGVVVREQGGIPWALPHLTDAIVLLLFFVTRRHHFLQLTYRAGRGRFRQRSPLRLPVQHLSQKQNVKRLQTSGRLQILLKNASDKDIILLRAQVREAGPHGPITDHEINRDHFFWGALSAGSSIRLITDERQPGSLSPVAVARDPTGEFRLQYVEFADGSTWGNELAARDVFSTRLAILGMLQRLRNEVNDERFVTLLQERVRPDDADRFFESLRKISKNKGTAAARQNVAASLRFASVHASAMRSIRAKK